MSEPHDCSDSGCKGAKFDGANLTCFRCLKPVFLECIKNKTEVSKLVFAMKSINTFSNKPELTPLRMQTKIAALFNADSVFKFECVKCKIEGTYTEIIDEFIQTQEKYKEDKEDAKREIGILKSKNTELEQACKHLQQKLTEAEQINKERELDNVTIVDERNTEPISEHELKTKLNKMYEKIKKTTTDSIITMTHDLEARIKMECEKLSKEINLMKEKNNRTKHTEKTTIKTIENSENDKNKKPNDEMSKANNNKNNNIDKRNAVVEPDVNAKLKPPKLNQNKGLFEIHISRFEVGTTESNIEEYIMEKTKIKNDRFAVELLNNRTNNYVSFKLITFNRNIYDILMNEQLWSPDFIARDFIRNKDKINNFKNKKSDLRRSVLERNKEKRYKYYEKRNDKNNSPFIDNTNERTPSRYVREIKRNIAYEFNRNMNSSINQPYYQQPFYYYMPQIGNGQHFLAQRQMNNQYQVNQNTDNATRI